jgi:hypothetical protein
MRFVLALTLFALTSAFAQEKPAATPPNQENATENATENASGNASENASGGATAPRPNFRRDAASSQGLFERLDKNHDGYLTGTELTSQEALSANWLGVDRNGDGRISRDEFTAVTPAETAGR